MRACVRAGVTLRRAAWRAGKAVSAENDACVWRTMVQAIRGLLEKYPDSLLDDEVRDAACPISTG